MLGYRIAESAAGRGAASWAVGRVCELARGVHGLTQLFADVSRDNPGSRKVLERNGFEELEPVQWDGGSGVRMICRL